MAADLDSLITSEIPEGRQNLMDSYTNLERVAEYCENNYFQCDNKRAALEETKGYTTQSLASVAYQINTLAYNFLQMLDLQSSQIREMESQINHIGQTVSIHKEKVARREIGVLTTNKCSNRQYKIIAPANPERPIKYVRKPIDYSCLDHIGHGVSGPGASMMQQQQRHVTQKPGAGGHYAPGVKQSQYGSIGNVSQGSAGPAPTSKPPTPPQNRVYQSGTLNRSKEYRTPPVVAPPQLPSNYAPNYPRGSRGQQYGTLPHQPQVGMVQPQPHDGGSTMPRLSSASMRSNTSVNSGASSTPPMSHDHYGTYGGLTRKPSTSSGDTDLTATYGLMRQTSQVSSISGGQYGVIRGNTPQSGMSRPVQRPPSPPLPNPPALQQQLSSVYATRAGAEQMMQRGQDSSAVYSGRAAPDSSAVYMSRGQVQKQSVENVYGGRPGPGDSVYSSRAQMVDQGYNRSISTVSNPENMYSTRAQMTQDANYKRSVSQSGPAPSQEQLTQMSQGYSRQNSSSSNPASTAQSAPAAPSWVPRNYLEKVLAIYDYNADKEDELTFQEGQIIYVLKKNDDGWWEGVMEGITGLFPGNYVESSNA